MQNTSSSKLKRGSVLILTKNLELHLSKHGSVNIHSGAELTVTKIHGDGYLNVSGTVVKRNTGEAVLAKFMVKSDNCR